MKYQDMIKQNFTNKVAQRSVISACLGLLLAMPATADILPPSNATSVPYANHSLAAKSLQHQPKLQSQDKSRLAKSQLETAAATAPIRIRDVDLVDENKNSKAFQNPLLDAYINKILELKVADDRSIERYMMLINKIPGYEAEYALKNLACDANSSWLLASATSQGLTRASSNDQPAPNNQTCPVQSAEMVIVIKERSGKAALNVNNYGSKALGRYQFGVFAQETNLLKVNESIIVNASRSNKGNALQIISAGYLQRINSLGTSVNFLYSQLKDNPFFQFSDKSSMYRVELEHYAVLNNVNTLKFEAAVQRKFVDETGPNGTKLSSYRYNLANLTVQGKHRDSWQADNSASLQFFQTLGSVTQKQMINLGSRKFDKHFNYITMDLSRDQPLSKLIDGERGYPEFSLFTQVVSAYTSHKLPLEQQFAVGSTVVGRGYRPGLISANKGAALEIELRYTNTPRNKLFEMIQPYGFVEGVFIRDTLLPINRKALWSGGAGVRTMMPWNVSLNLEAALPFTPNVTIDRSTRVHSPAKFSFAISKELKF